MALVKMAGWIKCRRVKWHWVKWYWVNCHVTGARYKAITQLSQCNCGSQIKYLKGAMQYPFGNIM